MLEQQLRQVWDQLRAKKPQYRFFLQSVDIVGLRAIRRLRVPFEYPVAVLAGPNGCGKSSVLMALACAYRAPGTRAFETLPSRLLPDFRTTQAGLPSDTREGRMFVYSCLHDERPMLVTVAAGKSGWQRRVVDMTGRRRATEALERPVYLRTLRNLGNPAEIRSMLRHGRAKLESEAVDADLIAFAQQVLPFRYAKLLRLASKDKDLLFATREDAIGYSEFHMSAGERALLRLSQEVSHLRDALILVDEIETGLHPQLQQQLMLQLQRLALRNSLQVVVATHSPAVLDTVPREARLFLERADGDVATRPPYRDTVQRAFYGRSFDRLTVLCEDDAAEAVLRGVFDVLKPRLGWLDEDLEVGRDSGKGEFAAYVRAFGRLRLLESLLFVLDGDARDVEAAIRDAARQEGQPSSLLFLPGDASPEAWVWARLKAGVTPYADQFGVDPTTLSRELDQIEHAYAGAADKPANIAKNRLATLVDRLARSVPEVCRLVARRELEAGVRDVVAFAAEVEAAVETWRKLRS
jgi:predicted ATPase